MCGRLVKEGRCPACRAKMYAAQDRARESSSRRGYDAAWRRCERLFLKANSRCPCGAPATEAHHVLSVRERPDLRLSWSNLRALCKSCHSRITAKTQAFGRS